MRHLLVVVSFIVSSMLAHANEDGRKEDPFLGLSDDKRDEFLDVAKDLRCPTCTGLSVLESDAPFSKQIKDIVKEQVQSGKNKDEVLEYFTQRYGPWILRAPPKQGFNLVAWIIPLAILIFGPILVWFFVWRRGSVVSPGLGVRSSDEIITEMNAELAALRASGGPKL